MNLDYEKKKLVKLEFQYNLVRLSGQDEKTIYIAKGKYRRQLKMFLDTKRRAIYEKKYKDSINLLEDLI